MSDSNSTVAKVPSSIRTFELVHFQQVAAKEPGKPRANREEKTRNEDTLRYLLDELEMMQKRLGELRFSVATMTTLIKDKLEHG